MRFVDAPAVAAILLLATGSAPVRQQRYCMGTMFDIVVYHEPREAAARAVDDALDAIEHLDMVLSHFKPESDLSRLNREARTGFVEVDPDLHEVIRQSLAVSRLSGGRFDITVAPLVRIWKAAHAEGRKPSAADLAAAERCVGYENIALDAAGRIRFRSDCLEIELGGIGKGYAVDRAIAVLRAAGIENAIVNGGSSSITAIGSPPGGQGWPVRLAPGSPREERLRDRSLSTSQQDGAIIDPRTHAPAVFRASVTVSAPTATLADGLSTALVMMTKAEAAALLERVPGVTATYRPDAR